jgi:hypothetical protein
MRTRLTGAVALGLVVALAGCGDDSFSPNVENVAGAYSATTFTLTTSSGTIDLLAIGSEISITLESDGTTTGSLFIPDLGEGGSDVEGDLTGTWTLSGSTVTFDQPGADTFIRDIEFTAERDRLTSEGTEGGQTFRLVLTKAAA